MVISLSELKRHMKAVIASLDHLHLDLDVPYFKDRVSTTENLAVHFWEELSERLPDGLMHEVKIEETDKNSVVFRGELA